MLLRFTNPSKRSTFNVRLVPDKNIRTIAQTVFPVGVSTNWLKFLSTIAEYAATIWCPHTHASIYNLERIQRKATRFVCNNYQRY